MIARTAARICAALLVSVALGGCAMLSGNPAHRPFAEVLGDPEQLKALADAAMAEQNFPLAYRYLSLIHILHPDSKQNREVFVQAAGLYRRSWAPHRTELDSVWTTSEPPFLFAWLSGIFEQDQDFPQTEMEALFLKMNYGLFRDFLTYASNRPHMLKWKISAEKDDGIVQKITGTLVAPNAPSAS
jgi:hypothetical protein